MTCSYIRKNDVVVPGRGAVHVVGGKVIEMCGPSAFISWLSHLICRGEAPGLGTVNMR